MQYAFNVDTDLSCMRQGAPIETLSKVHCILFTDRLVLTTCCIFFLEFALCLIDGLFNHATNNSVYRAINSSWLRCGKH
jgi:hypothetical protein